MSDDLRALMHASPFHRFLDVELAWESDGEVRVHLPFKEDLLGDPDVPYLHGGVLASVLDIAANFAVRTRLGRNAPTIDMRVDYLRVGGAEDVVVTASVVKLGRSVAVVDAEAWGADERLLAVARLLLSTKSPG
jgi:uncharacterized protein (TIGR00369 family)